MATDDQLRDEPADSRADASDIRFESWKEIAAYLNRGVTTVQRWERSEGLPVRRQEHISKGSVYALRSEIDAWRAGRERRLGGAPALGRRSEDPAEPFNPRPEETWDKASRWRRPLWLLLLLAVAATLMGAWIARRSADEAPDREAAPTALANEIDSETGPSVSPDGTEVAYHWRYPQNPGIYIKPTSGGVARRLDTGTVRAERPTYLKWSPRGDLIAFLVEEGATRGVYVVAPTGGTPRRLTSASGIGLCWAHDGASLGFVDRNATSEPFSVFMVVLATGERSRVTTPPAGAFGDTLCAFSGDGQRLAVVRYAGRDQSDIFTAHLPDAGRMVRLTYDLPGLDGLSWTPDAREIVFGSHNGLWRVAASGEVRQEPVIVGAAGLTVGSPSFSSSAHGPVRLVFQNSIRDVNIWRWDAGAPPAEAITRIAASRGWNSHPAFSLDGRRIAFASNRTGFNEIWTAAADGRDPAQVTFHRGPIVISPQWSLDGERLAFSSQSDGNRDVFVIRADGSESGRLTWNPSQEDNPTWSRDGRWIYFRSDRGGRGRIWKMPAEGGTAFQVTRGDASHGGESADGALLYFVRSVDTPGLWAIPTAGGDESLVLPHVTEGFWAVCDTGIVFLLTSPEQAPEGPTIQMFDVATSTVSTLVRLPASPNAIRPGLAVTRDCRSVLWTRFANVQNDIMLMDEWRR